MRILLLSNLFPPAMLGGYERACANVAAGLAARGHTVRVLSGWSHLPLPAGEPDWIDRGLDLSRFFREETSHRLLEDRDLHGSICSSLANTFCVLDRMRRFRPDIVYVWNVVGLGAAALLDLLNRIDVPWAIHLMDRVPSEIIGGASPAVLGLFDAHDGGLYDGARVLVMSRLLLDEIESMTGFTLPQAEIVPGWVDLATAVPHAAYRRDGTTRFVTAGALIPQKGIGLMIEAAARLKGEQRRFRLDIYGDGDRATYVAMARAWQVDDRVRFLGPRPQPELIRLLADYDAFLFPTWEREPFGFAPLEAAGSGTPPIMTRNCGAAERLVDEVHCLKIDRDPASLAAAMTRVATGSVDLARLGRAGQRLVAQDLTLSRALDRIEAVLQAQGRPWRGEAAADPKLPLLLYLKHHLSLSLRFG